MSKGKKRNKPNDDLVVLKRYLYAIILIVLAIIALLHNDTGILGEFLCNSVRFLFGKIWFIPFMGCIVIGFFLIKNIHFTSNRFFIAGCLFFVAGLIICCIPTDKTLKGNAIFDQFILQAKAIYLGQVKPSGGLIGVILYALFSNLIDYVGTLIIIAVLMIVGIVLIFSGDTMTILKQWFQKPQKMKKVTVNKSSKKQNLAVKNRQPDNTFINLTNETKKPIGFFKKKDNNNSLQPIIRNSDIKKTSTYENQPKHESQASSFVATKKLETKGVDQPTKQAEMVSGIYNANNYVKPSLLLLDAIGNRKGKTNSRNAVEKWNKLDAILDSFGLPSELQSYNIGPSVTQFEIVPLGNFNIKKYSTIEENIKMELEVKDIRIQAPIPGKRAVGIEIPNEIRDPVKLRELLDDLPQEYQNNPLIMALGKDLGGNRIYGKIDKMPHLLIAGSTGSGKSVCINSIILSILYLARPDEVKLILIDPKKVEFTPYSKIPHLACPIINDTSKAADALKKLVALMEERYNAFAHVSVRNIKEFNQSAEKKMCSFVCIIDELADLMSTHGKEVEQYIARLAAMARAAGIYLILSTQRPSTDVITGTIKNNIASRIALSVGSSIDSRTIIDSIGAESLLGNGDMLYKPTGLNSPIRVQGCYVSDEEVRKVCSYFEQSGYIPQYEDIFIIDEEAEDGGTGAAICEDPLYPDIKKWVCSLKTISASGLQRRYGLGFPRAAKLIDALEQDGVISSSNGSKPRDVLVKNDPQE